MSAYQFTAYSRNGFTVRCYGRASCGCGGRVFQAIDVDVEKNGAGRIVCPACHQDVLSWEKST